MLAGAQAARWQIPLQYSSKEEAQADIAYRPAYIFAVSDGIDAIRCCRLTASAHIGHSRRLLGAPGIYYMFPLSLVIEMFQASLSAYL